VHRLGRTRACKHLHLRLHLRLHLHLHLLPVDVCISRPLVVHRSTISNGSYINRKDQHACMATDACMLLISAHEQACVRIFPCRRMRKWQRERNEAKKKKGVARGTRVTGLSAAGGGGADPAESDLDSPERRAPGHARDGHNGGDVGGMTGDSTSANGTLTGPGNITQYDRYCFRLS
jgi:hypothetical protein